MDFIEKSKEYCIEYEYYIMHIHEFTQHAKTLICRKEYAKGGVCLHRGYYCPSPILDLVTGNCNRGHLIKNVKRSSKYSYEYCFDNDNHLICVNKYENNIQMPFKCIESELLIYSKDSVLSIIYELLLNGVINIIAISKCVYNDGNIERYDYALFFSNEETVDCIEIKTEKYDYHNNKISTCIVEEYNFNAKILRRNKYYLNYNEEDFLVSYTVKEYDGEIEKSTIWDNHVFYVKKSVK